MNILKFNYAILVDFAGDFLFFCIGNVITKLDLHESRSNYVGIRISNHTDIWRLPRDPQFMRVDPEQEGIYCTFSFDRFIYLYSYKGEGAEKIGKDTLCAHCQKNSEYNNPHGLVVCRNNFYVCDKGNNCIQVVDKRTGNFHFQWGKHKGLKVTLRQPRLIEWNTQNDQNDLLYVVYYGGLKVFTLEGDLIEKIAN